MADLKDVERADRDKIRAGTALGPSGRSAAATFIMAPAKCSNVHSSRFDVERVLCASPWPLPVRLCPESDDANAWESWAALGWTIRRVVARDVYECAVYPKEK